MNKIVLLFFCIVSVGGAAWAAEPAASDELSISLLRDQNETNSEFIVSVWKTGEGLPANELQEIRQTPDGYLWIGTYQGLVRFDGLRFQNFFSKPEGRRYGNRLGPLENDAHGRLWIAPDEVGLIHLKGETFSEVLTNDGVLKARVTNLCSDGTNEMLWVDAAGRLGRFSTENPTVCERIKGGNASGSSRWLRDFNGQLWLENPRGLKTFQRGKWREIQIPGSASLVSTPRHAGGLWIAREAKLRFVTADGMNDEVATFPWKGRSRVTALLEDSRQRLWIGTVGQGIYCYSGGEFQQVLSTASSILSLFEDQEGNVWSGTRGGGLVRIRERQFLVQDLSSGLPNEFIRSLSQDKAGRIWLLTAEGGLGWWQSNSWHGLGESDGWRRYDSLCVLPSEDGSVWVSTARRGLWRWTDGTFTRKNFGTKAPKEPASDLLEDRSGRLWMVTDNQGIYCLDHEKLTRYSTREGLPSTRIRRMIEDEAGELWAGDWEGGVARLRGNHWEIVRPAGGHGDAIRSMTAGQGVLWIGTSAGGLLRLKDGKTSRISVDQGLPNACIQQLLLDDRGSLWGSTPHRLFRISLDQLNAVMDGRETKVDAITYGRSDGLPDASFASWSDPRCWRTTEGELWFASANGAIRFQPKNFPKTLPPEVLLEQVLVNGQPTTSSALKQLRPGSSRVEFRFTAPSLSAPERVRFRYQLTGVDLDWVDAGKARSATYAGVPAGNHVFRVVASSPEGVWNPRPATLAMSVTPFFWQTNWFLAAVAATLAGGGAWMLRRATVRRLSYRLEKLRQQNAVDRERTRIAQDIHDELGANLTSIGLLADMGTRHKMDSFMVARELRQISETARESVAAMDAIVWALNPRNDSLDHFANYVAQFTRDFFRPTQLRTRLELPANLPPHPMSTETRHQLFLIVKECCNNIVRHADASEVKVEMECENGSLRLVISDNGKGLSGKTARAGQDGLLNLQERIQRLGGTLRIESENDSGTRLEFILPVGKFGPN